MKKSIGTAVFLLSCVLAAFSMAGCNTFKGAGKDIEKGGQGIEKAADKTEKRMENPQRSTITATAQQGGMITPSGTTTVAGGSRPAYTITPNSGHHVADVLVDGKSVGAVNHYTFDSVTGQHTISAVFAAD
jgi:predicted small secreted protein